MQHNASSTISETLERALQLHEDRQSAEAERLCREVLVLDPRHAAAWYVLGAAIGRQDRIDEAIAHYRQALAIDPWLWAAARNLAALLRIRSEWPEARRWYELVLAARPDDAQSHFDLADVLRRHGEHSRALEHYARALELAPDMAEAHLHRGLIFQQQDRMAAAEESCRAALRLKGDFVEAHHNLGTIYHQQRRYREAVECFQRAIDAGPLAETYRSLGSAYFRWSQAELAETAYGHALKLDPHHAETLNRLGTALQVQGKLIAAAECFDKVLSNSPDNGGARYGRGVLRLLAGDLAGGWPDYEWRSQLGDTKEPAVRQSRWQGQHLPDRTILLTYEQGLGDTLQFIRYAPLVKQRCKRVIFLGPSALEQLLSGARGIDRWVDSRLAGESPHAYARLVSLPLLFGTDLASIPNVIPYLHADAKRVDIWRRKLAKYGAGLKVGIAWQGNPEYPADAYRSIPLEHFVPLGDCPHVRLFSLQKPGGRDQLSNLAGRWSPVDLGSSIDRERGAAFVDTAAVMQNLDLVITSDTAIAHLAGGLGVKTWVVLQYVPDWRWLLDRDDSPWYPTMRLFRQARPGDWAEVFERVRGALGQWATERCPAHQAPT
ncbi:MAG TPA: tetratricopeptide repeat protein [Pirellulales bacterium]|nr:tetratricopeptide repeat protein [Pirellulales bacterium]